MDTKAHCFVGMSLLVLIVTWAVPHGESDILGNRLKNIHGLTVWSSLIGKQKKSLSMIQCVANCLQNSSCYAVKRFKHSTVCTYHHWFLHSTYANGTLTDNGRPLRARFMNDARSCVLVRPIPVLLLRTKNVTERFNQDEAATQCQKIGGQLATLQQLSKAWQNGYRTCTCGWLNDGTAYVPAGKPHPNSNCTKEDFRPCRNKTTKGYHAYCSTEV